MSAGEPSATTTRGASIFSAPLAATDPELAEALRLELGPQRDDIELIASENYVSRAVLEAQGSVLTNKYAEGLPGRRYSARPPSIALPQTPPPTPLPNPLPLRF